MTLLELSGPTDPDMKWLGWTLGSVPVGSTLHRLSHPAGRHMTYSTNIVVNRRRNCGTFNSPTNFINTRRSTGSMRGGSSGSAITNSQGQIVGQLLGSCGSCNGDADDCLDCQVRNLAPLYFLSTYILCISHILNINSLSRMLLMVDLQCLIPPLILGSI